MQPSTQIDPVSAAVAVFAAVLSPAVAHVMGVYSIIFIASAFGSGWALMRRDKKSLWNAIGFVLLMTGTATLVTVGVAQLANRYLGLSDSNTLLAPVALLIGAVGHDWPTVVPKLFNFALDFISKFRTSYSAPATPAPPPAKSEEERAAEARYTGVD